MKGQITQYHLKVAHERAERLITHIRFLHSIRALKKISHEGKEGHITYVCLILKRLSEDRYKMVLENLESLGLEML